MLKFSFEYGKCLKSHTYHEVRISYLKNVVDNSQTCLKKYQVEWKKRGLHYVLLLDRWKKEVTYHHFGE